MDNLISVVLPVYNGEEYLEESIESILNQSYQNFELIIINDGSTDDSQMIIKKYLFNDKIIYISRSNKGLIKTLNEAIRISNGTYIARMDQDDICFPNRLEKQLNFIRKTNSILTGTQGYLINNEGNKIGKVNLPLEHKAIVKSLCKLSSGFIHPSVMFNKEAVQNIGGYNHNYQHAEDFDLFLRLSRIGKITNQENRLIYLRKHETNDSFLNAEDQITNSIISKEVFCNSNFDDTELKVYLKYKEKVKSNRFHVLYIKLHTFIILNENIQDRRTFSMLILLKIIRRGFKVFI